MLPASAPVPIRTTNNEPGRVRRVRGQNSKLVPSVVALNRFLSIPTACRQMCHCVVKWNVRRAMLLRLVQQFAVRRVSLMLMTTKKPCRMCDACWKRKKLLLWIVALFPYHQTNVANEANNSIVLINGRMIESDFRQQRLSRNSKNLKVESKFPFQIWKKSYSLQCLCGQL